MFDVAGGADELVLEIKLADFACQPKTKLYNFLARRSLPGPQKCLNQRTFSADNHLRKAFEPFALRNFRISCKPIGKLTELISRNFPFSDSIEQMIQQCRRKVLPPNLRHLVGDRRSRG